MIRATISEVKNRMSAYLRLVKSGESVLVMERKTPIARIVPMAAHARARGTSDVQEEEEEAKLARLERAGVIVRGSAGSPLEALGQPLRAGSGILEALHEERSEESGDGYR